MDFFPAVEVVGNPGCQKLNVSGRYAEDFQKALVKYKGYVQVILKKPESPATEKQNRMLHGLLGLYWKSGLHSYSDYKQMRNTIKKRYGVVHHPVIDGQEYMYLVSWADYTRIQRSRTIDGLKAEMEQAGILSSRYADEYLEIIEGVRDAVA